METVVNGGRGDILLLLRELVISPGPALADSTPSKGPSIHLNKDSARTALPTALFQMGRPSTLHGEESGYSSSWTGLVRPCHVFDAANNLCMCT